MLTSHPRFEEASALFIVDPLHPNPDLSFFWGGYGAHLDFTNPATIAWWKRNVTEQLLAVGIDTTWNDNNEFNGKDTLSIQTQRVCVSKGLIVRHDAARCYGFGQPLPLAALRPVQTMLMVMASWEAQREHAPQQRPWLLTRAGGAGIQRYAATWSGDNRTSWKVEVVLQAVVWFDVCRQTLRFNIPMGLGEAHVSMTAARQVTHPPQGPH
jgi:alpha-glucosidase